MQLQILSGIAWFDTDRDGRIDADEEVVSGVTVQLLDGDGNPVLDANGDPVTTTTGTDGSYRFEVAPGEYAISFGRPDNVDFTSDGTDMDADPGQHGDHHGDAVRGAATRLFVPIATLLLKRCLETLS